MQSNTRRSFVRTAAFSGAAIAFGAAMQRPALAAEDIKDVKFAQDPKNLQAGLEAAHTPSISIEKLESKSVAYGKTPAGDFYRVTVQARHEATQEHHMSGIALYVNGQMVADHTMTQAAAAASLPTVSYVQRLKAGDELLAVTNCNLHGKWGNRTAV